jgi:hypothetical protein
VVMFVGKCFWGERGLKRKREEEGGIDGGWWWAEVKEEMWDGRWAVGLGGKRILSGGWFGRRANRDEWLVDTCPVARPSPNPKRTEAAVLGYIPNNLVSMQGQLRSAEQVQNKYKTRRNSPRLTQIAQQLGKAPVSASQRRKDASSNNLGPLGINAVAPPSKKHRCLVGYLWQLCANGYLYIQAAHTTSDSPTIQPTSFFAVI